MAKGPPQGQYPDGWWPLSEALGKGLGAKTETQLQKMLDDYDEGLDALKS